MTAVTVSKNAPWRRPLSRRPLRPDRVAAWTLGFAPVVYLAMSSGGYDIIARSEVGVVIWWLVLLGALIGLLPRVRFGASGWIGLGLVGGFLAWTWIAVGWSQSEERTLAETARLATYLGVLALGLSVITRRTLRDLLNGLAAAVALVSALAVLSRLVPAWFPADSAQSIYATARLRYPFDYSDGVGEFAAFGLPLLMYVATSARSVWGRALGAMSLPTVAVCLAMTVSRGGLLASVVGMLVFFALMPDRLPRLGTALTAAGGSAIAVWALLRRAAVRDEFLAPGPAGQRHAVLAALVVASLGVGVTQAGITLVTRSCARARWVAISRNGARVVAAVIFAAVIAGVVALVATGADHRLWQEFKRPTAPASSNQYRRLLSVAGSHRYQYWQVALHAFDAHPWKGIGPGTFEFYWSQHNSISEFVRNAHSLYIETLAELGIVGLTLIGGFVAVVLVGGSIRALRAPPQLRMPIATAVAAFAAFAAAASFDWVWQIGVIPVVAMLLAAVALAGGHEERSATLLPRSPLRRYPGTRLLLAGGFAAALVAIAVPLTSTIAVRSSQAAVRSGHYPAALKDALSAQRIEPSAATPRLQRALVLEQMGDLATALRAIDEAAVREPTNWRIWLVASRLAAETGHPQLALAEYRRARSLNPTSPLFR